MFRIRRIYDDAVPGNREAIRQVREIFRAQFAAARMADIDSLADHLRHPLSPRFSHGAVRCREGTAPRAGVRHGAARATAAVLLSRLPGLGRGRGPDHHGNGQQEIFYRRDDVLTVSIHGHPNFAYPYFTGFADEHAQRFGQNFISRGAQAPGPCRLAVGRARELALHG